MLNKTLLGSAAVLMTMVGAQAADLPSKKAAPATYVKICDAYGAGYFFIPGTETCLKVGGRVRYDAGYAPKGDYYGNAAQSKEFLYIAPVFVAGVQTVAATNTFDAKTQTAPARLSDNGKKGAVPQDTWGQHYRAQISLDARTPTAYGVARTYMVLRMSQSTGLMGAYSSPYKAVDADNLKDFASTGPTVERAFIQFAGFTVGRANSIFSNGPSLSFGSGSHFTSFANGVVQAAYTAVLGGGFSATIGMEDPSEHKATNAALKFEAPFATPYDSMPVIVGNVAWDQSWGRIQVSGAVGRNRSQSLANPFNAQLNDYDITKNSFAYAGFLTLNADMLGKGNKFYLLGGYSDGDNSLGFKDASNSTSNNARDIDGIAQSYKNFTCLQTPTYVNAPTNTGAVSAMTTECQNTKSTWLSAAYVHNWSSTVRQNVMAGVAYVDPGSIARASSAATQKATFSAIGTNLIWTPVKDFDIGVEVLYNRSQVGNDTSNAVTNSLNIVGGLGCNYTTPSSGTLNAANIGAVSSGCRSSGHTLMGRVRIERTF